MTISWLASWTIGFSRNPFQNSPIGSRIASLYPVRRPQCGIVAPSSRPGRVARIVPANLTAPI